MLGAVAGCVAGAALGTVLGLVPGCIPIRFRNFWRGLQGRCWFCSGRNLAAAIVATMVTHTFVDAVSSTFLRVPDPDTVLSVLPAHRLCFADHGDEAVRVSALGSVAGFGVSGVLGVFSLGYAHFSFEMVRAGEVSC